MLRPTFMPHVHSKAARMVGNLSKYTSFVPESAMILAASIILGLILHQSVSHGYLSMETFTHTFISYGIVAVAVSTTVSSSGRLGMRQCCIQGPPIHGTSLASHGLQVGSALMPLRGMQAR